MDRRRFLLAGAALRGISTAMSDPGGLRLEYTVRKPPEIPPPLRVDSTAGLVVEFSRIGTARRCVLALRVALEGRKCLLPLALWTGDPAHYRRAREALRLPAILGDVSSAEGRWSLTVGGREVYSVRAASATTRPSDLVTPLPWVTYRHSLDPDWRQGPLAGTDPEVWMLRPARDTRATEFPADGLSADGDPGGWLGRLGASGPVSAAATGPAGEMLPEFERTVTAADFQPFALRNYQGVSVGTAQPDMTFLQPDAIAAYRGRREVRLSGVTVASIDAAVDREAVVPMLPPPCHAPETAVVRVMGLRGLDDPSLDEAWLFAQCHIEGARAWYAVSHVRGQIEGSELGREVLGYPTVRGTAAATLGANRFGVSVGREGSQMYEGGGFYGGFSTGTSLAEMLVASLRLRHRARQSQPAGEIVIQPWRYQGLRLPVSRESLFASFAAGGNGRAGAWNRIGAARAYWAAVFDSATLQRLPGTVAAEVDDVGPYYRDRCEGRLPWEAVVQAGDEASD